MWALVVHKSICRDIVVVVTIVIINIIIVNVIITIAVIHTVVEIIASVSTAKHDASICRACKITHQATASPAVAPSARSAIIIILIILVIVTHIKTKATPTSY